MGLLAVVGCRPGPAPTATDPVLIPVLVHDPAVPTDPGLAAAVTREVAAFLARAGMAVSVAPTRTVASAARAVTLIDFTEAAAPCDAVGRALRAVAHPGEILIVLGGHISSTLALRQLYGVSCGGRAEDCSAPADAGGVVLVDRLNDAEISLAVVAAHELGHVLGLRHPFEADCGATSAPEGAMNLMALERDVDAFRLDRSTVSLGALQLTPAQTATILVARNGHPP